MAVDAKRKRNLLLVSLLSLPPVYLFLPTNRGSPVANSRGYIASQKILRGTQSRKLQKFCEGSAGLTLDTLHDVSRTSGRRNCSRSSHPNASGWYLASPTYCQPPYTPAGWRRTPRRPAWGRLPTAHSAGEVENQYPVHCPSPP